MSRERAGAGSGPLGILEVRPAELAAWVEERGEPSYRAEQILGWVYQRGATSLAEMTNLPRSLRGAWAEELAVFTGEEVERSVSPDGTAKLLLRWPDGSTTESVMIPATDGERPRRTVCLSTQVGCDVGCRFCASGIGGSRRNLTVGEILEQAVRVAGLLREGGEALTHVVFMGMGEPLANYEATVETARRLNADWGLRISQRRITISTVGLPKQMERLADEGLSTTLALSLHAPEEALRRELIPWAKGLPLARILDACRTYFEKTGREVTLEYCLLAGVNDRPRHAERLAAIARDLKAHVNLMMYNPVPELSYERPERDDAIAFLESLRRQGARAHLRESRGLEADAACGQLRRRHETGSGPQAGMAARGATP